MIRVLISYVAAAWLLLTPLGALAQDAGRADAIGAFNIGEKKQEVIDDAYSCAGGGDMATPWFAAGAAIAGVVVVRRRRQRAA